jgi:menaquinone-dependent protoporphyrinogen IX oxidase
MSPGLAAGLAPGLRRRTVLRGGLLAGALASTTVQAACTSGGTGRSSGPAASGSASTPSDGAPSVTAGAPRNAERAARVLVVYFSRAGENYRYGDRVDLEVGNTEVLAGFISAQLEKLGVDHDVHRLEAAEPYPDDYDATVARNVREQDTDARPALANPVSAIDRYDAVLVGSPIWNVRPPMLMRTFAEAHDFTGTTVYPFVTFAVSGLGTAERDYSAACRGAEIGEGLAVQGETVRADGPAAAATWLDRITLPGRPTRPRG